MYLFELIKEKTGLRSQKIADRLRIPISTLRSYEQRRRDISTNLLARIKLVFGLTWADIGTALEYGARRGQKKRQK